MAGPWHLCFCRTVFVSAAAHAAVLPEPGSMLLAAGPAFKSCFLCCPQLSLSVD